MPFPRAPRVKYEKSSLVETICQFRFTPVLQIDHELPVTLQELLRRRGFPSYERRDIKDPGVDISVLFSGPRIEHVFGSLDNATKVVLTRDFLAVDTNDYPGWNEFVGHVAGLAPPSARSTHRPLLREPACATRT